MTEHMHEELREDAGDDGSAESGIDVVLVTGLSGAGRGTAAKVLEDLGWYVADNLPPELIAQMVELGLAAGSLSAAALRLRSAATGPRRSNISTSISENLTFSSIPLPRLSFSDHTDGPLRFFLFYDCGAAHL